MSHLRCSNAQCGATFDLHDRVLACPRCADLMEVAYAPVPLAPDALKARWRQRRGSLDLRDRSGVWRFREFLPDVDSAQAIVSLGEGNVPVLPGPRSAAWCGLRNVSFKHLGWNPTGCFKDLGMTVGMTEARYLGAKTVACASTGNTAASMSAYAARAGIAAHVYLPKGAVSAAKLAQSLDYGAEVVEIDGNFDQALQKLLASCGPEVYFLNSINPFRVEGQKTVIFELLDQREWDPPDYIVVPGGNLGNTAAFGKALEELRSAGLIEKLPRLVVVQAEGANPLVRTWRSGVDELQAIAEPETAATAIRIGAPRSWKKALRALRFTDGTVLDVTDQEIAEAKAVIGSDGIGCEPASATTLAGIRKLVSQGHVGRDASVVAILTGHVLKDTEYIIKSHASGLRVAASREVAALVRESGEIDITVPASIANLGPGLDTLAVAVQLYLQLQARFVPGGRNELHFDFGDLRLEGTNAIECAFLRMAQRDGRDFPALEVAVRSDIPLGAGLGSSAAATVAGLRLYAAVNGVRSDQELLQVAAELEGHPDNAAAALLGGLASSCQVHGAVLATASPWPPEISFIVLTPELALATPVSRRVLPKLISRADAVFNAQRVALLFQALQTGDYRLLKEALRDRWHQPFRGPLVPGLQKALELEHPDLLGVCLSGAGPSLVALAQHNHSAIAALLEEAYAPLRIPFTTRILRAHPAAAQEPVLPLPTTSALPNATTAAATQTSEVQ